MNKAVHLNKKEILYDISNKVFSMAEARRDGMNHFEGMSSWRGGADESFTNEVCRAVDTAIGNLRICFARYLAGVVSDDVSNDLEVADGTISLEFELPSNFNEQVMDGMAKIVHAYIVNQGISIWLLLNGLAEQSEHFEAKSMSELKRLKVGFRRRQRPKFMPSPSPPSVHHDPPKKDPDATEFYNLGD